MEEGGADIEVRDKDVRATALWLAANNSHVDLVEYLLGAGADADAKNGVSYY